MIHFNLGFSPYFEAFFYLLWLGYPFSMLLTGLILYLTIPHYHLFGDKSQRISSLVLLFTALLAISSFITVTAWIRHCIIIPVILFTLIVLFSILLLIVIRVKQKITVKPVIAIIVLYVVEQVALICLYFLDKKV